MQRLPGYSGNWGCARSVSLCGFSLPRVLFRARLGLTASARWVANKSASPILGSWVGVSCFVCLSGWGVV